jgi:dipeptidyl aminopeptidase/acylaminoacyl peptidase
VFTGVWPASSHAEASNTNEAPATLNDRAHVDARGHTGLTPGGYLAVAPYAKEGPTTDGRTLWLAWHPSGKTVLATLPCAECSERALAIFAMDVTGNTRNRLAIGEHPRMSPDGNRLAFLDSEVGLCVVDLVTDRSGAISAARQTSGPKPESPAPIADFAWAPDSSSIVFSAVTAAPTNRASVPETMLYRYRIESGESHRIFTFSGDIEGLAWTPAGLYFAAGVELIARVEGSRFTGAIGRIQVSSEGSGTFQSLQQDCGHNLRFLVPSVSPDGERIAFGCDAHRAPPPALFMRPAALNLRTGIARTFDLKPYALAEPSPVWLDSRQVVYKCKAAALFSSLCVLDAQTGALSRKDFDPLQDIARFSIAPDGRLALLTSDPNGRMRVAVYERGWRRGRTLTSINRYLAIEPAFGEIRTLSWSSADGVILSGLLVLPVGYRPGTRYPLVVDIHGGPNRGVHLDGSLLNGSGLEWQMWAAQGYAVLVVDYRAGGVAGLDEAYHRRVSGFKEDGDIADVLAAIDAAVRVGVADGARVGAIGHSYGAVVLEWLVARSKRLASAIIKEGAPSLWDGEWGAGTVLSTSEAWLAYRRWLMGATEPERLKIERANASITYTSEVSTPVLYVSGDTDRAGALNVPRLYVDSINAHGGTARLISFAGEGHVFTRRENQRDLLASALAWFAHYLRPNPAD